LASWAKRNQRHNLKHPDTSANTTSCEIATKQQTSVSQHLAEGMHIIYKNTHQQQQQKQLCDNRKVETSQQHEQKVACHLEEAACQRE
jgi:hypothetical protein